MILSFSVVGPTASPLINSFRLRSQLGISCQISNSISFLPLQLYISCAPPMFLFSIIYHLWSDFIFIFYWKLVAESLLRNENLGPSFHPILYFVWYLQSVIFCCHLCSFNRGISIPVTFLCHLADVPSFLTVLICCHSRVDSAILEVGWLIDLRFAATLSSLVEPQFAYAIFCVGPPKLDVLNSTTQSSMHSSICCAAAMHVYSSNIFQRALWEAVEEPSKPHTAKYLLVRIVRWFEQL